MVETNCLGPFVCGGPGTEETVGGVRFPSPWSIEGGG